MGLLKNCFAENWGKFILNYESLIPKQQSTTTDDT